MKKRIVTDIGIAIAMIESRVGTSVFVVFGLVIVSQSAMAKITTETAINTASSQRSVELKACTSRKIKSFSLSIVILDSLINDLSILPFPAADIYKIKGQESSK